MAGMAFSVIVTGVFLYPLIEGLVKPNPSKATVVAVTVGSTALQGGDTLGMGGNVPNIAVYAEDGSEIGRSHGSDTKTWAAGTTQFVSINPSATMVGRQATYVSVSSGGNNGLCVSAISVAWPNGKSANVWLGDLGQNCSTSAGPGWSNSKSQTGADKQDQSKCIWIDGDNTNGFSGQGIGLHISDFGSTNGAAVAKQWTDNKALLCNAPGRMHFYDILHPDDGILVYQPPLEYNINGTDKDPNAVLNGACDVDPELLTSQCQHPNLRMSKRSTQRVRSATQSAQSLSASTILVHSSNPTHSAEEVCNHPASVSPSFVSHSEGKFCDMGTRIVWPLCSDIIASGCFDSHSSKLVTHSMGVKGTYVDQAAPSGNGSWERVEYW